jgi:hypothetical protein
LALSESHDDFLELCALSTAELLSGEEGRRLEEHLRACPFCREIQAQYQALVDAGIPIIAVGPQGELAARPVPDWSMYEAEAALFAQLDQEETLAGWVTGRGSPALGSSVPSGKSTQSPCASGDELDDVLWRQIWLQYAASILLALAAGYSLYRVGFHKAAEMAATAANLPRPDLASAAANPSEKIGPSATSLQPAPGAMNNIEAVALRAQLEHKIAEIVHLNSQRVALEANVLAAQSARDQMQQNVEDLTRRLTARQVDLQSAKQQLDAASGQISQGTVTQAALERQVKQLEEALALRDQEVAREQDLLDHDRDIRELMGARNLYISEVYDVARNGQTQRPFGRVFYTQGKSLIFYAYDLDQQAALRESSTFQAWGRRGTDNARPVSLGIFYADNAAQKRWALKANDPMSLTNIDAVFVTAEPYGGSSHPSGKPLLFAYLRIEPNHP